MDSNFFSHTRKKILTDLCPIQRIPGWVPHSMSPVPPASSIRGHISKIVYCSGFVGRSKLFDPCCSGAITLSCSSSSALPRHFWPSTFVHSLDMAEPSSLDVMDPVHHGVLHSSCFSYDFIWYSVRP